MGMLALPLEASLGSPPKGPFPRLSGRGQQGAILQRKLPARDPPLDRQLGLQSWLRRRIQLAVQWGPHP